MTQYPPGTRYPTIGATRPRLHDCPHCDCPYDELDDGPVVINYGAPGYLAVLAVLDATDPDRRPDGRYA